VSVTVDEERADVFLAHIRAFPIRALAPACLISWARRDPDLRDVSFASGEFEASDDPDRTARAILARKPRLVGFSCYVWNHRVTRLAAKRLKELAPEVRIVLGGPEVSGAAASELARFAEIDFVCCGEGEETFRGLVRCLFRGDVAPAAVPGLAYREDGRVAVTAEASLIDIAKTASLYPEGLLEADPAQVVLETSRGCPFTCTFCDWGPRVVRYVPEERLEAEFAFLARRTKRILTTDADLAMNARRGIRVLEAFLRASAGTDCVLVFELNPVFLAPEITDVIARAPKKFGLAFGIQSIRPDVLENVERSFDLAKIERNLAYLLAKAPEVLFMFSTIYGLPGDDLQGMRETVDWCLRWRPALLRANHPQVLPGTAMERDAAKLGMTYQAEPPHQALTVAGMRPSELSEARVLAAHLMLLMNLPMVLGELLAGAERRGSPLARIEAVEDWIAALAEAGVRVPGAEAWSEIDGRLVAELGDEAYARMKEDPLTLASLMHVARGVSAQPRKRRPTAARPAGGVEAAS
jgi:radical SAM superfamily enzyme YgiQ (UPF0313 family)